MTRRYARCWSSEILLQEKNAMHETKLRYSEPVLRAAVRVFVLRSIGRHLGIAFFVVLAGLVADLAWLLAHHDRGWMVGFLVAMILFVGAFFAAIYVAHYRNTIGKFRQMLMPEATFGYDEEQFEMTSELGSATMPWSAITEVWRYPRFWLLLFSRSQFVTLPIDCLDEPTQAFITRKTAGSSVAR